MARRPGYWREYYARRRDDRIRAVNEAAEADRALIAALEEDGYRAPHRRVYDRTPPSAAELRERREEEWKSFGFDLSHRPPVVREKIKAYMA